MSGVSEFIINFADTKRSPVLFYGKILCNRLAAYYSSRDATSRVG